MITIIIPVYNAERYLHRCLQSVFAQTYKSLEVIIVNDGSTDRSLEICNSYVQNRSERVIVLSQSNLGVSAARNKGLNCATGKYVMFLDSDDYMFPDMCEVMLETIEKKNADCVICGTMETLGSVWAIGKNVDYDNMEAFKENFIEHLTSELLSPPWNKIYKRELITEGFDTSVSFGEDLMFNLRYLRHCKKISFLSVAPFYHEKANENSLVNRIYPNRLSEIETVHSAVLDYYGAHALGIHNKYLRDIVVYLRAFMQNDKFSLEEKIICLDKWMESSHLKGINLRQLPITWKNRLLFFFLRHKLWHLAYFQINWRTFYKKRRCQWNIQF